MKKLIILILALICAGMVFGQTQQKVAVYVTGNQEAGINKILGDQLVSAFVKSGKYTAIERTSSFLTELSKEQSYQRTGNVDDNELSRLGKQFGVQLVCIADVSDVFGEKYVSARLIDVESAEVINTSNASSPLKTINDLMQVAEKISKELAGKTGKEQVVDNEQALEEARRKIAQENAERQIRFEQERATEKAKIAKEERNKAAKELGESIGNLINTINSGTIQLINKDKDPFYIYIDGKYNTTISGYSTLKIEVPQGNHIVKVEEKSGYTLYKQVETFGPFYIKKGETQSLRWD
ncbi:MAG: hypothetical protein LBV69_08355 [Bacteroidales bacterium]|jgi:hypothetical protein|nr:hypothetical protein [Bacteroidales bacterium]